MVSRVNGFKLEVTAEDGGPVVRIGFSEGEPFLVMDRVSLTGLQKMPEVFERAAKLAFREMEAYYQRQRRPG